MVGSTYRVENLDIISREVSTNRTGAGAYRAPGLPPLAFALETVVDEIAWMLEISPIALRRRNVARGGDLMADGVVWPPFDARLLLDVIESHPLWSAPLGPDEGRGIALGMMRGATESASASARLNPDGTLSVIVGSIDLTGTTGALTQIAAEVFGVPPDRVKVLTAPTDAAPHSGGTGGSKIVYTVGNAVMQAAGDARRQALAVAADALEVRADDLEIDGERVVVIGAPDRAVTLAQVHARTVAIGSRHAPVFGHGNVANPEKGPTSAVHLARVKVDRDTGAVRVTGYVAAQDVGKAINPAEIDGQIHGAVVQGIGWGLSEGMRYDDDGQLVTGTFMDYAMPHGLDLPPIETIIVENPSPDGPFGARGVGEVPIVPPAAAIANAIHDATGLRPSALPMTPESVWRG
jgi:CO/xanthine dehydrogenase Mo-binding subunit